MTHEIERCRQALHRAAAGDVVALISSGDAGIYGMAGLAFELAEAENLRVPMEIVPGVTAASAAAAALGAPLMLDFAVISLSDLLVSWEVIRRRLEAVAAADLVVALYNPRSRNASGNWKRRSRSFGPPDRARRPWESSPRPVRTTSRWCLPIWIICSNRKSTCGPWSSSATAARGGSTAGWSPLAGT